MIHLIRTLTDLLAMVLSQKIVDTEIPFDYELFDGNTITPPEYRLINQTNVGF